MNGTLRKTRDTLTHQDFKNINEHLFKGQGYSPNTLWRMVKGERTTPPVVDEAIEIYLNRMIDTAEELDKVADELLAKHGYIAELIEA